ncbi:hypothetical protein EDC01DRAFT_709501 [Geopyxis carbonaria]|nr:hypothetical protein EDC01DRAFT_709501 [Geopyxis carbonaria]
MSTMIDAKITALQPFILLSKTATGRAAAELIGEAIQAPSCYVFSELLSCPNIVALESSQDYSKHHNLLKIFAYGSFRDYQANASNLPPLNERQTEKLKQLSLITLASRGTQCLTYKYLLAELELPSVRALEDLVITAIYEELLEAKLDTKSQFVEVVSTMGRDVAPAEIPAMVATLNAWCEQCESVLADIDEQVKAIHLTAIQKKKESEEYERMVQNMKDQLKDDKGIGGKGKRVISDGGEDLRGYEDDEMDLDEGPFSGDGQGGVFGGANTSRRRTKGRFSNMMPGNKRR